MKKYMFLFLASLLVFTACQDEVVWTEEEIYDSYAVSVLMPTAADLYDTEVVMRGKFNSDTVFEKAGFYISEGPFASDTDGMRGEADSVSAQGTFFCLFQGVDPATTYFVRPFGKTGNVETLGKVLQFKTSDIIPGGSLVFKSSELDTVAANAANVYVQIDTVAGIAAEHVKEYGFRFWEKGANPAQYDSIAYFLGGDGYEYSDETGFKVYIPVPKVNTAYEGGFYYRTRSANIAYMDASKIDILLPEIGQPALGESVVIPGGSFLYASTVLENVGNDIFVDCGFVINGDTVRYEHTEKGLQDGQMFSVMLPEDKFKPNTEYTISTFVLSSVIPTEYFDRADVGTYTTKDEKDMLIHLADIDSTNYEKTVAKWYIATGATPTAGDFAPLKAILSYAGNPEYTFIMPEIDVMPDWAFGGANNTQFNIVVEDASLLGKSAFNHAQGLQSIVVGPATSLDNWAVGGSENLHTFTVRPLREGEPEPTGVFASVNCFRECNLTHIHLPYTSQFIGGGGMFSLCKKLEELRLPRLSEAPIANLIAGADNLKILEIATKSQLKAIGVTAGNNSLSAGLPANQGNFTIVTNYDENGTSVSEAAEGRMNWTYPTAATANDMTSKITMLTKTFNKIVKTYEEAK